MKSVIRIPFLMGGAALAFLMNYELSQHYFAFPEEEEDGIEAAMEQERQLTEDPALHRIPKERLLPAAEYRAQRIQTAEMLNLPVSGITWTERGPSNIGGRTPAILFDLNDAPNYRKIWAGGVGGGLWYTNDITVSSPQWNKVNDLLDNLAISCIAQSTVNKNVLYLTAEEEDQKTIAQANEPLDGKGLFQSKKVKSRFEGDFPVVEPEKVTLMDIAPNQIASIAASMIPFLEHDDANRALMGSNMQRQAVPTLLADKPLVGTGMEANVARDSGVCVIANREIGRAHV